MHRHAAFALVSAVLCAVLSTEPLLGQTTRPARTPAPTTQPDTLDTEPWGPLGGPRVADRSAPGVRMGFGSSALRFADRGNGSIQQYRRVLSDMDLEPAQEEEIQSLLQSFGEATRDYNRSNAREIASLRRTLRDNGYQGRALGDRVRDRPTDRQADGQTDRPTDRAGDRAGADAPMTEDREATIEAALMRLREIRQAAPRQDPYMVEIFALLTPAQQQELEDALNDMAAEAQRRRDARVLESMEPSATDDDAPTMDGSQRAAPTRPNDRVTDRAPEQIRELMDKDESELTRAERRQLDRFRQRVARERDRLNRAPKPPTKDDIVFEDDG